MIIFMGFKVIQDNTSLPLNDIQKKVLENEIRDFKLSGCHLNNEKKDELKEVEFET